MNEIDLDALGQELLKSGTDERLTRALLIFGRHVNRALEESQYSLEDRVLDLILKERNRGSYDD